MTNRVVRSPRSSFAVFFLVAFAAALVGVASALAGIEVGGYILPNGIPAGVKVGLIQPRVLQEDLAKTEPGSKERRKQVAAMRRSPWDPVVTYPWDEFLRCKGRCDERLKREAYEAEQSREMLGAVNEMLEGNAYLPPSAGYPRGTFLFGR